MKKILIVMFGMGCGGAEKSLISFLNLLPKDKWKIDLAIANPHGMYMKQIPEEINFLNNLYDFENLSTPLMERRRKVAGIRDFINQCIWQISYPFVSKKEDLSYTEIRWKLWGKNIPKLNERYDLAIAYINGIATYYTIDKVNADKKIVWIHNEFEKMGYNYQFEKKYYEKSDRVVTISQECVDSFLRVYPEYKNKTSVIENISSETAIKNLAKEVPKDDCFFKFSGIKIVSVGRLMKQKGYDYAIDAASILKKKGIKFIWYVLGEGELRKELENQIEKNNLQDEFKLVGIKDNPFPYVANCDIFAQTSRFEGKSIALDEAKILCKPILVSNYVTAKASISNNINGKIVDMNPEAIAMGLYELSTDSEMRNKFITRLKIESNGNECEIEKYINIIEELLNEK